MEQCLFFFKDQYKMKYRVCSENWLEQYENWSMNGKNGCDWQSWMMNGLVSINTNGVIKYELWTNCEKCELWKMWKFIMNGKMSHLVVTGTVLRYKLSLMVFCRSWSTPPLGNRVFRYWRRSDVIEPEKNERNVRKRIKVYFMIYTDRLTWAVRMQKSW